MEYFDTYKMKAMGQRIQDARKRRSLLQSDLAEELGISIVQMSNIEKGRSACKPDYIYQLVQILGVSSDYLFFGREIIKDNEVIKVQNEPFLLEKIMLLLLKADEEDKDRIYRIISIMLEKRTV